MLKKIHRSLRHLFHPHKGNRHRAHLLHPEAMFVIFLLAAAVFFALHLVKAVPGLGHVLGFASSISVQEVVEQTNARRAAQGLPALQFNDKLSAAARSKGEDMFAGQYWAHTSPTGLQPWSFIAAAGYSYSVAGENLARDFSDTSSMVQAWMDSPTHRANIENAKYQEIGVAVINGQLEGYDTTLVVQMFGTPRQQAAAVTKASASETRIIPEVQAQAAEQPAVETPESPVAVETATANTQPVDTAEDQAAKSMNSNFIQLDLGRTGPAFTPLMITKAVFIGIAILVMFTLLYDIAVVGKRHSMRIVGKNLAHFLLMGVVVYLILFFKAGVIG